jgi:hypothetical protein
MLTVQYILSTLRNRYETADSQACQYKMASEMQNSNPIILNAADLPTRLPKALQKPYAYGTDVFSSTLQSLGQSGDSFSVISHPDSEEDNDMSDEPIDEQEIFGKKVNGFFLIGPVVAALGRRTKL